MFFLLLLLIISLLIYYVKFKYNYWKKRNVSGPPPSFPFGNLKENLLLRKSSFQTFNDIYNEFKGQPFIGIYRAFNPILIPCDLELIKEIMIKSFTHFEDNNISVDKKLDPIFGRNPFSLKGEEWKRVRACLTPGMTSGKMKQVHAIVEENARKLINFIEKDTYEVRKLSRLFTLENIATCVFGVEAGAFSNNLGDFHRIGENASVISEASRTFLSFLANFVPFILKIVPLKKEIENMFINFVSEIVKYRRENQIDRQDFFYFLQQLNAMKKFEDIDVVAHSFTFFLDGYTTSASAVSFTLYQLARNPEIQEKLRDEIVSVFERNGNKLPYEILQELPYLEATINEALRLHPPLATLERVCTKNFNYVPENPASRPVTIEKGTVIVLPVSGIHYDSKFYEDPTEFKPERFLKPEKEKILKCAFMPFGEGPRICIGRRFGLLQVKLAVAYISKNFILSVDQKTKEPLEYDPGMFLTTPVHGLWLKFQKYN